MSLRHGGSPGVHTIHGRERRRLVVLLTWALVVLNFTWAAYLLVLDQSTLARNPLWAGALATAPAHTVSFAGVGIGFAAMLLLATRIARFPEEASLVGYGIGCVMWATLAGSFLYASAEQAGLGFGNAALTLFAAFVHGSIIWLRRF